MYFPHVELVFLLFAYQGASVAEARMIRSGCLPLVVLGACALVRTRERERENDTCVFCKYLIHNKITHPGYGILRFEIRMSPGVVFCV